MESSVFSDVRILADHLAASSQRLDSRRAASVVFERILTASVGKTSELSLPLAHFSYFFRSNGCAEKADVLDSAVEKLYKIGDKLPAEALQIFLAQLANVDVEKAPTTNKLKMFLFFNVPSDGALQCPTKKRVLPYMALPIPRIIHLPNLDTAASFPLVPSYSQDAEKDEGFSDCSSQRPEAIESVKSLSPPSKKSKKEAVLLSQMTAKDFDCVWRERMLIGPFRLLLPDQLARTVSVATSFTEFARCFHSLTTGVSSWIFTHRENHFELASGVRIVGISVVALRNLMTPFLELGNSVHKLEEFAILFERYTQPSQATLGAFRLGLIAALRRYQWETLDFCVQAGGVVDLVTKYEKYCTILRQLSLFCHVICSRLQANDFTAKWLLDTLLDLCKDLRFSSSFSFFFTLFEHTLRPHLQLLDSLVTDAARAAEAHMEEMLVAVDKEAFLFSDRQFWTNAVTLRLDQMPVVFSPLGNTILWTIKMSCLLHRLEVEGPVFTDGEEDVFSLSKIVSDPCNEPIKEDTLGTFLDQLGNTWRTKFYFRSDLMKDFIKTRNVFGKFDLLSICADLRSTFLLENGDFASTIVQELFAQLKNGTDHAIASDFFDVYSLNRALEKALRSNSLPSSLSNLDLSFVILPDSTDQSHGYLSIFDQLKLDCSIPWPANIVLTASAVNWYRKPFGFLLKLELTLWLLTEARARLLAHSKRALPMHCTLIRLREIDFFARNLKTYLLHQVADVSWAAFVKTTTNLREGEEFDAMYEMHNHYVTDFITRCLLNPKAKKLFVVVEKLLKYATDFGMIALMLLEKSAGGENCHGGIEDSMAAMDSLYVNFSKTLKLFYFVLCKLASRGYQPHMSDLLLRMNYNYFYDSNYNSTDNST